MSGWDDSDPWAGKSSLIHNLIKRINKDDADERHSTSQGR